MDNVLERIEKRIEAIRKSDRKPLSKRRIVKNLKNKLERIKKMEDNKKIVDAVLDIAS